jgi:hypothetical protein
MYILSLPPASSLLVHTRPWHGVCHRLHTLEVPDFSRERTLPKTKKAIHKGRWIRWMLGN